MQIKILGGGCSNCNKLEQNVREALANLDLDANIEKIKDYALIAKYGILSTPALMVNERVLSYGTVLSISQIEKLLYTPREKSREKLQRES